MLGLEQFVHLLHIPARGMARNMHKVFAVSNDLNTALGQIVLHSHDRPLVTRDHTAGINDRIPFPEGNIGVHIHGNARKGRAWLALTARNDHKQLVVGYIVNVLLAQERQHPGQIPTFTRSGIEVAQGAAHQNNSTACCLRRHGNGFHPRHVGGKTGHCNAPLKAGNQFRHAHTHFGLGARGAGLHDIRAVADQRKNTLLTNFGQTVQVCSGANQRFGVKLPVPCVHHNASGCTQHHGLRFGYGVCNRHKFNIKRPNIKACPRHDHTNGHIHKARFCQFTAQHGAGKRGNVNRALQHWPHMRHSTNMVLVGMGNDQPCQLVPAFHNKGRVRDQNFCFRGVVPAKTNTAINSQPCIALTIQVEVHADLTRSTQGQKGKIAVLFSHIILLSFSQKISIYCQFRQGVPPRQQAQPIEGQH